MKALAVIFCLGMLFSAVKADSPDFSKMTEEQLVDALQSIQKETVGIDSLAWADAFLAEDKPPKFMGGVVGAPEPTRYPQMQLLVQRGVKALPVLLQHLDDVRPTKLSINPAGIIMWGEMDEEYSPRVPNPGESNSPDLGHKPEVKFPYVVKVGDVCFVLIGQIVGRPLSAARYQPTGGLIINSPVTSKKLVDKVRKDWAGITEAEFRDQLIKDAQAGENVYAFGPALQRLSYYFPDEYLRQKSGLLAEKIKDFEKQEK